AITKCEFIYTGGGGPETSVECSPPAASIGASNNFVPAKPHLIGLSPSPTSRFKLYPVHGAGQTDGGVVSQRFTTSAAPTASPASCKSRATKVTDTTAQLNALVDPEGQATGYRFEYLSDADFVANGNIFNGANPPTKLPSPDSSIGSATTNVAVSEQAA